MILKDAHDKGAVDLHNVAVQILERGKRRIARAEVVHRNLDAVAAERIELRIDKLQIADDLALRKLQDNGICRHIVSAQTVLHELKEGEILDLLIAHIDAHVEIGNALTPLLADTQRLFKDPAADGHNRLRLFEDADELHRCDHAPLAVLPAKQSFSTYDVLIVPGNLRLEVELEIAAPRLYVLQDLLLYRQGAQPAVVDFLRKLIDPILAARLRRIECRLCIFVQDERIARRLRVEDHASRDGNDVLTPIVDLWVSEFALYADEELCQHLRIGTRIDESELIAVKAVEGELARDILQNALRDLAQDDIADLVVERLVDRAEVVNTHDEEAAAPSCLSCLTQRRSEIHSELVSVEQSRHGVCRVAPCELADRPNEEIRRSIHGSADLSLEPQPRIITLCIPHAEVKLALPPVREIVQ